MRQNDAINYSSPFTHCRAARYAVSLCMNTMRMAFNPFGNAQRMHFCVAPAITATFWPKNMNANKHVSVECKLVVFPDDFDSGASDNPGHGVST